MRGLACVLVTVAAAGCASAPDRLETAERSPVPRPAAAAGDAALARPLPSVLPAEQVAAAQSIADAARTRGHATLADCFRLAEATNEDLLSADEDRLQALLRRDQAIAGIQPSLSLSAYAFAQDRVAGGGSSSGGSGGGGSFSGSSDREQWAFVVRQPVFKGFAEFRALEVARRSGEARAAVMDSLRNALRRSVARAFFGVLAAEADVRTLEESEKLDRTRVGEMRARLENGIARRSEVLLLESQLQQTLGSLRRARTQRDVTRAVLDELVGVPLGLPLLDAAAPIDALPSRDAALAEAIRARPELKAAGLNSDVAEAQIAVVQSGYWPTASFVANRYMGRSGFSSSSKETNWDAQINLDFPFFEGGATQARERTARSDLRKARLAESGTLRSVVQDVESTLASAAAGAELLGTFERNVQIATENLALLREEYAHGIATNLEVLTAQNNLQAAQLELERQRLLNRLDRVELSLALGRTETDR